MTSAVTDRDAVTLDQIGKQQADDQPYLVRLFEERKSLQTQLTQIQSMLHLIEYHISEEILRQAASVKQPN
jgi:hypothetical protein